jgi:hypothetical protein
MAAIAKPRAGRCGHDCDPGGPVKANRQPAITTLRSTVGSITQAHLSAAAKQNGRAAISMRSRMCAIDARGVGLGVALLEQ